MQSRSVVAAERSTYCIFVSSSTSDLKVAKSLSRRMLSRGYSCERFFLLDRDEHAGIKSGQRWEDCIVDRLRHCKVVLAICSPECVQRPDEKLLAKLHEIFGESKT